MVLRPRLYSDLFLQGFLMAAGAAVFVWWLGPKFEVSTSFRLDAERRRREALERELEEKKRLLEEKERAEEGMGG